MTTNGATPPRPFSPEAEEAVIGSILLNPSCLDKVAGRISPGDFFLEEYRVIFKAMMITKEHGKEINLVTIGEELQKLNAAPGIIMLLSKAISNTLSPLDADSYATEIYNKSFYRKLTNVSSEMVNMIMKQDSDIDGALDKCDDLIDELRTKSAIGSRRIILGDPRLMQTNPPRYIWNVNGKDLRLNLSEITQWGKFKNRVISELNFVPERPKNWDDIINGLIIHSVQLDAPIDASEEQQLKIAILGWFERRREATVVSDLKSGQHIIREIKCKENKFTPITYYCFQSTPLLDYLKKEYKRNIISEDLWVYIDKWHGIRHEVRVKSSTGATMPIKTWCLPVDFIEDKRVKPIITDNKIEMPADF